MKRSDRENALFADPNDANNGKKMCLDPECWKSKSLSWCKNLIAETPGMVPIRHGFSYGTDNLGDFFGVKPVSYYDWQERTDSDEEREGYAAAIGVLIDGPNIGTTKSIWLELADDNEDRAGEDADLAAVHNWRENSAKRHQERQALAELIAADITAYLADIDTNATIPTVQLAASQLRAAFWFGIGGFAYSEEDNASLDNPYWNPLLWAWEQTAENIAEHIAAIAAEDIVQLYNGDQDYSADTDSVAALVAMFEIPLDVIATRATDELYATTHDDHDGQDSEDREKSDYTITFPPVGFSHVS